MRKKFYRFPNGSYFRLDRITFIGKVEENYGKYRLAIDIGGNTINSIANDYNYLEQARRAILVELGLEYRPIPAWKIRLFRWFIPLARRLTTLGKKECPNRIWPPRD